MSLSLAEWNALPRYRAESELLKCCGSTAWARNMTARRPFASFHRLLQAADEIWWQLDSADWLEAFSAHPRIGEQKTAAQAPAEARTWSAQEQASVSQAGVAVVDALSEANLEYLEKFGYIFIVCASGKSAEEMLSMLRSRLPNSPVSELRVAAEEQHKITRLRLEKLVKA